MNKQPQPTRNFARGTLLSPKSQLLAWLDQHKTQLVRLPLVLDRGDVGWKTSAARMGGAADALEVRARDTALGISLSDRAEQHCKGQPRCALLVEGHWRGLSDEGAMFDVTRVYQAEVDLATALYADVEVE